jgi:hypothetical protein
MSIYTVTTNRNLQGLDLRQSGTDLTINAYKATYYGFNAGTSNTGAQNTFIGYSAGAKNTIGAANSFFGYGAGSSNIYGNGNLFMGTNAGDSNTVGNNNTFLGNNAGMCNTGGNGSVLIGSFAGVNVKSGNNVAIGFSNDTVSDQDLAFSARANVSIGAGTVFWGTSNINVGNCNTISGKDSISIGNNISNSGSQNFVVGTNVQNTGSNVIIIKTNQPGFCNVANNYINLNDALILQDEVLSVGNRDNGLVVDPTSTILKNKFGAVELSSNNIRIESEVQKIVFTSNSTSICSEPQICINSSDIVKIGNSVLIPGDLVVTGNAVFKNLNMHPLLTDLNFLDALSNARELWGSVSNSTSCCTTTSNTLPLFTQNDVSQWMSNNLPWLFNSNNNGSNVNMSMWLSNNTPWVFDSNNSSNANISTWLSNNTPWVFNSNSSSSNLNISTWLSNNTPWIFNSNTSSSNLNISTWLSNNTPWIFNSNSWVFNSNTTNTLTYICDYDSSNTINTIIGNTEIIGDLAVSSNIFCKTGTMNNLNLGCIWNVYNSNSAFIVGNNGHKNLTIDNGNFMFENNQGELMCAFDSNGFDIKALSLAGYWNQRVDPVSSNLIFQSKMGTVVEFSELFKPENLNFTGKHRCVGILKNGHKKIGMIVSSTGRYVNLQGNEELEIDEALPVVDISRRARDPSAFGIVGGVDETGVFHIGNIAFNTGRRASRLIIQSHGEGIVWVSNINGCFKNGDLITTSAIRGYGMKQKSSIRFNYTIAKITCDCDFSSKTVTKRHKGVDYKSCLVGCLYMF